MHGHSNEGLHQQQQRSNSVRQKALRRQQQRANCVPTQLSEADTARKFIAANAYPSGSGQRAAAMAAAASSTQSFFGGCMGGHGGHTLCPEVSKALAGVMLIAEQKKRLEESTKVRIVLDDKDM